MWREEQEEEQHEEEAEEDAEEKGDEDEQENAASAAPRCAQVQTMGVWREGKRMRRRTAGRFCNIRSPF